MKNRIIAPESGLLLPKNFAKLSDPKGLGMWAKWELEIRRGSEILEKKEGPSHSFVRNFGKIVFGMFDHQDDTHEVLTEIGGGSFSPRIKSAADVTGNDQPVAAAVSRIRFGNSSAALDSTQTHLQGTILASTFGTMTFTQIAETSVHTQFRLDGQVTNNTGSSFTVEEMGMYARLYDKDDNSIKDTLVLRDLTGSTVVADTLTILGRWTFTLAV
jgi:hypothetical protein